MHELHIQPPGTTNRPAAFKLLQKTHSTILASNKFISNACIMSPQNINGMASKDKNNWQKSLIP
jgi:hypothetical protein